MCDDSPNPISTSACSMNVPTNWIWKFPSQTISDVTFSNPISNIYGMNGNPVMGRAVCNFSVSGTGLPSCVLGFFTRAGNLYIDTIDSTFCAYQIGKQGNSYIMRSQDGSTTSTLTPQS
jgi:hypothetical protein